MRSAASLNVRQLWRSLPTASPRPYRILLHLCSTHQPFSTTATPTLPSDAPASSPFTVIAPSFPLRPVKGTHDFLPPESVHHHHLSRILTSLASRHSFLPIQTPILENAALILHSLPSSDLAQRELFHFLDHGTPIILRPEGTAGVVRALIGRGGGGCERYWYEGPMFRRERPQKGRYRQFTQFGVEVIGEGGVAGEVDAISLAWEVMRETGIDSSVNLHINSLGDNESRMNYCTALKSFLLPHLSSLSPDSLSRFYAGHLLRILDSKHPADRSIIDTHSPPLLYDHLTPASRSRFDAVLSTLRSLSIPFVVDPFLVRGLDYYCHTAFEILPASSSSSSNQSALLAGGRYDGLFPLLGGKERSAVGWALGMERMLSKIKEEGKWKEEEESTVAVIGVGEEKGEVREGGDVWIEVMRLTLEMRRAGLKVATALEKGNASKQLGWAAKSGMRATVIVGEDEVKSGIVQVKDMRTKQQQTIQRSDLMSVMQQLIGNNTVV